jgi:hypothetical protein
MSSSPLVPPAGQGQSPDTVTPEQGVRVNPLPERIGRYHVEKLLGKGGFGCVYVAHDEQLCKRVVRGGGVSNDAAHVRSANRNKAAPAFRDLFIGFRPARTVR